MSYTLVQLDPKSSDLPDRDVLVEGEHCRSDQVDLDGKQGKHHHSATRTGCSDDEHILLGIHSVHLGLDCQLWPTNFMQTCGNLLGSG